MNKGKIKFCFLILLTILFLLISCNSEKPTKSDDSGGENADSSDNGENTAETTTSPGETRIQSELPEMDFGGYVFNVLSHEEESGDWVGTVPREIISETETGDSINDAVYKRNSIITEKYNFEIAMQCYADENAALRKAVKADEDIYDAVIMIIYRVNPIITSGLLTDVSNLTYVDLSKPWWDSAVNSMSIDRKNYLLAGDMLILDNEATNALIFNKDLLTALDIELPYKSVSDGTWTMDKFTGLMKDVALDLNGDGVLTPFDDRYGFIAYNDTLLALLVSGGGNLALKDENDMPYICFNDEKNVTIAEKAMDLMYNPYVLNAQQVGGATAHTEHLDAYLRGFEENRTLFMWIRMRVVELYRGLETNFGILPMPKFSETQENYYSLVSPYTGVMLGIPQTASDLERTSVILEALAAESRYTLKPAYYDIVLQRKFTRDEESRDMLDIIFNSRIYDIGSIYNFGNVASYNSLASTNSRDVMSFYDKSVSKMEKDIEKIIGVFQDFE